MRKSHIEVYKDKKHEWRWRLVASNGRKLSCSGEGFKTKATCYRNLHLVARGHATAKVREV